jgi:hypothetical protein
LRPVFPVAPITVIISFLLLDDLQLDQHEAHRSDFL